METQETAWMDAYLALRDRIQADERFHDLVRAVHTRPSGHVPSQRMKRVALVICERLDLDPAIYLGNVFGAALDYVQEHSRASDILGAKEAAEVAGITESYFRKLVATGDGPVVYATLSRGTLYLRDVVERWAAERATRLATGAL